MKPAQRRAVARYFRAGFEGSERRARRVAGVARSTRRYRNRAKDQAAVRVRLRDLAAARVRYGYRRPPVPPRREGWRVNHERIHRLSRDEGRGLRVRRRRKRVSIPRVVPAPARRPHERWSLDFLTDGLADGRRFRVLTVGDNVSRVSPAIAVDTALTGERVVEVLGGLRRRIGTPERIAIDTGPESVSKALDTWAYRRPIRLEFSRPGKPTDHAYVESFNGHFRAECLDQHWFESVEAARQTIERWRVDSNTERPHRSLKQQTPAAFAAAWTAPPEPPD